MNDRYPMLIISLILLLFKPCWADTEFQQLVEAIQVSQDTRALNIAEKLEDQDKACFGLYYNQGLAFRNLGRNARARASFERALHYEPRNLDARRRLREVKDRLSPQLAEKDVRATPFWTAREAGSVLFVSSILLLVMGGAGLLGRPTSRRYSMLAGGIFLAILILTLLHNPPEYRACVISSSARLLAEPRADASGPVLLDGLLVEVQDSKAHFIKVKTRDGESGWVREAEVAVI